MDEGSFPAPPRVPNRPHKKIQSLKINTSPSALHGDGPPGAVERKHFGNSSPPPSLCSCANCADYPDAVEPDTQALDFEIPDPEILNSHHQAKRDTVPRGKRPRAKPSCLYADERWISESELDDFEVSIPATEPNTAEVLDSVPIQAFPMSINDRLTTHACTSPRLHIQQTREADNGKHRVHKASDPPQPRRTYPKTPAPASLRRPIYPYRVPNLETKLATAIKTTADLQRYAWYISVDARELHGQLEAMKHDIDEPDETWRNPPRRPLGFIVTIIAELTWIFVIAWCTLPSNT